MLARSPHNSVGRFPPAAHTSTPNTSPPPSQHQASPFLSTPSTQEKIQRESSTPKAVTPPRQTSAPPSPSVLDIVLRGDISLPPSPEVAELEATWKPVLTGSPPIPAFSPPTFSQVLRRNPSLRQRQCLLPCTKCNRSFYTQSGLAVHTCQVEGQMDSTPLVHVEIKSRPASDVLGGRCEHQFATGIHNSTKGSCVRPRFSKVLARGGCDYYFAPTISISPSSQQNRGRSS
ncbi:hypothetical protein TNCV_2164311 [Trichonephila clavipes]|nr:hypothetical protein TNCV_2164311 [Trichonephila clavipes]